VWATRQCGARSGSPQQHSRKIILFNAKINNSNRAMLFMISYFSALLLLLLITGKNYKAAKA